MTDKTDGHHSLEKRQTSLEGTASNLDTDPIKFRQHDGTLSTQAHDKDYMELTLRSGNHSELVKKILRSRIEARAKEFPRWPGDTTGGVRAMWIESRFWYDRERMSPDFDDDWRSYRARYLHSLELDPKEPVRVLEYENELINPIRKFYMRGGDWLENNVIRRFAKDKYYSSMYRVVITRGLMGYFLILGSYYYVRYFNKKWDANTGPELFRGAPVMYPGHPQYPFEDYKTEPSHHWDIGFSRRTIYKDLRGYEDKSTVI